MKRKLPCLFLCINVMMADVLPYRNSAVPIEQRVSDLLGRMTLEEKVNQLECALFSNYKDGTASQKADKLGELAPAGLGMVAMVSSWGSNPREISETNNKIQKTFIEKSRLGIPVILHEEGAHGFVAAGATSYPVPPALASTWNPELVHRAFSISGKEVRLCGSNMVFTPVLDLARDPRWGRCEETYGEDPYLVSQMGLACVTGYQGASAPYTGKRNVAATLKHYTGHGSPESGINISPTKEDARTLADIHQLPFKTAVQQGRAMTVMASYNEINGVPLHVNQYYLDEVLRKQWGFEGLVVSDWYGVKVVFDVHQLGRDLDEVAVRALQAGVDLETPDFLTYHTLEKSVAAGKIDIAYIDRSVRRVLRMKFEMGLFDDPYTDPAEAEKYVGGADGREVARQLAEEGIVLLKNQGNVLPLIPAKLKTLALIGPHVSECDLGGYSGTPKQKISVLEGVKRKLGDQVKVVSAEGVRLIQVYKEGDMDEIKIEDPAENAKRIAAAVEVARAADTVVLCIGQNHFMAREAWAPYHRGDNASLELRAQQNDLVREILKLGKPTVVALFNGTPLAFEYINENVPAILECWYLGQETGDAFANVLFGDINPSGKLAVTMPRSVGQLPVFYNRKPSSRTRGYVLDNDKPLYEFGHGLSYTEFAYSNLRLEPRTGAAAALATVSIDIANTGKVAGKEIVQLYVHQKHPSITRPVKELRDFAKISLQPGEKKTVTFRITPEKLAFHDLDENYVVEADEFEIMVGASSEKTQTVILTIDKKINLPEKIQP